MITISDGAIHVSGQYEDVPFSFDLDPDTYDLLPRTALLCFRA